MKHFFKLLVAVCLAVLITNQAKAQFLDKVKVGVVAGYTYVGEAAPKNTETLLFNSENISGYQIGATVQIPIALGFSVQPSLLYQRKGSKISLNDKTVVMLDKTDKPYIQTGISFLELPVQLQWGPDLMVVRPYIFVEPFLGMRLHSKTVLSLARKESIIKDKEENFDLKRMEYGMSLGGGIEFLSFQLSAKYFWNFGNIYDGKEENNMKAIEKKWMNSIKEVRDGAKGISGFTISLAYLF